MPTYDTRRAAVHPRAPFQALARMGVRACECVRVNTRPDVRRRVRVFAGVCACMCVCSSMCLCTCACQCPRAYVFVVHACVRHDTASVELRGLRQTPEGEKKQYLKAATSAVASEWKCDSPFPPACPPPLSSVLSSPPCATCCMPPVVCGTVHARCSDSQADCVERDPVRLQGRCQARQDQELPRRED